MVPAAMDNINGMPLTSIDAMGEASMQVAGGGA